MRCGEVREGGPHVVQRSHQLGQVFGPLIVEDRRGIGTQRELIGFHRGSDSTRPVASTH